MGIHDPADAVREAAAGHGAGRAGIEVGQQRDRLLAVPGALDGIAPQLDQVAQLGGRAGSLDLEVAHLLDLARHPGQERRRQRRAAGRRVLHHHRDVDGIGDAGIELHDLRLRHPEGGAVVGRHHHHHGRAQVLRLAAARGADLGAEVGGRDDHRHAPGHVLERRARQDLAVLVGQQELLGEVRQDAQAGRTGIDHEVEAAPLARQVERAGFVEGRGHDREDAAMAGLRARGRRMGGRHGNVPSFSFRGNQCEWRGTALPRQPTRKSRSQPSSACST